MSTAWNSPVSFIAGSLLAAISAIMESVETIEVEHKSFIEIGCYLYRVSPAIRELQTSKSTPKNAQEILQSMDSSINLARDLVYKCQTGSHQISDAELSSIIAQLEMVIKDIGDCLCLIRSSAFEGEEYAETAIRCLSDEMQNAQFSAGESLKSKEPEQNHVLAASEHSEQSTEDLKPIKSDLYSSVESDLYSVGFNYSTEDYYMPRIPSVKSSTQSSQKRGISLSRSFCRASITSPTVARYIEPLYDTFYCPLTKDIMDDPVTLETGVTYERKAITEWFETFEHPEDIFCPITRKKLTSSVLSENAALKSTIEEWKERNEVARIKVARAALSLASTDSMVLEAIEDLKCLCQQKPYNRSQVCGIGMLPLLVTFLEDRPHDVMCATLELLREVVQEDEGKETVQRVLDFSVFIKLLSSHQLSVIHASLLFLLELTRSVALCDIIGSTTGLILVLIRIMYNSQLDRISSKKAGEILENLEGYPENIKRMAENGFLEPLLHHLAEGCEELQMEMASYLGEIVLGYESRVYVAEKACPSLIRMIQTGNSISRGAALRALAQISSHHQSGRVLVEASVVQIMTEEIFTKTIYSEPVNSKQEAARVLANILESGIEHENAIINTQGHKISSDYFIYNIICMLKSSVPEELNICLIRILLCLMNSPKSTAIIVAVVKETDSSYSLIEFINNPHEELGVAAIRLLTALSAYMGHTLAERLCKTRGLPGGLIEKPLEVNNITEKQAVSAKLLAKIPHQNLTLNLALLSNDIVPTILDMINLIQRRGTRVSRFAGAYLEGLVGVLVRFTTTLYEPQMLFLARNYNFTLVFTELLTRTTRDEVQRLSAIGLENLSSATINLSRPPQVKKTKFIKSFSLPKSMSFGATKGKKPSVCPIHRGACSSQETFCLVDAKAIERLLACMDHENPQVVEAAMAAICTLLDDKVDTDESVKLLSEVNAVQYILNVVKEHEQEGLKQKSFWMIEKFLVKGKNKSVSDISHDRLLPATLISAFHHGDGNTKQMAEKILRHLNKIPNLSTACYTIKK